MNDVTTTTATQTFRRKAANRFHEAADMTLHQLCDEYARLSEVVAAGTKERADEFAGVEYTDEAAVALRERQIVNAAAKARFGIGFEDHYSL